MRGNRGWSECPFRVGRHPRSWWTRVLTVEGVETGQKGESEGSEEPKRNPPVRRPETYRRWRRTLCEVPCRHTE